MNKDDLEDLAQEIRIAQWKAGQRIRKNATESEVTAFMGIVAMKARYKWFRDHGNLIKTPANTKLPAIKTVDLFYEGKPSNDRPPLDYYLCLKLDRVLSMGTASACEQVFGFGQWKARRVFTIIQEWDKV
jgi:hypothetical protein